ADWGRKWAAYESGSGTSGLTFAYTVVEPNYSTQGIAVLADTLELNGGSIRSTASRGNAALSHTGLGHDAEHKVDWGLSPPAPNRAPVVNTEIQNYTRFVGEHNAPRGVLVSKSFAGLFSDPDGDQLTYAVSITGGRAQLAEDVVIGSWGRSDLLAAKSPGSREATMRVFLEVDGDDDWDALEPPLPEQPVITVTLTATDPGGLSASLQGDFLVIWEPETGCELAPPERVSMLGIARAGVASWEAPSDDDACEPAGYLVGARSLDGGEWVEETAPPEARSHVLDDLTPGQVEYHVTTIYPTGSSDRPLALPQINVPAACNIRLAVAADVDSGISGTWTNVAGAPTGCVFGPEIEFQFKQSTWDHFRSYGRYPNTQLSDDSFIAYDLKPGVTYDFKIVAVDAAGRTNESNVASATVLYDADAADDHSPRNVRVVVHNRGNAYVTWEDSPTAPSGQTLTKFIVEWKTPGGTATTKEISSGAPKEAHITGLTDGTAYLVRVAARRTDASSTIYHAWSGPTPFTARLEPIQVWFTGKTPRTIPRDTEVRLFLRVHRNTPAGITVCPVNHGGTVKTVNCPIGTQVHTDVSGVVSVKARSTDEDGTVSESSETDSDLGGAEPPEASASGGNGTIVIVWSEVEAQFAIGTQDAWVVQHRKQNADKTWPTWTTGHVITDTSTRSHTFTGLADGTWQVRVRPRHANVEDHDDDANTPDQTVRRDGFASETFTVTVDSDYTAAPGPPTGITITPGVGSLTLEWEPPTGGGSAVDAYQVRHRRGDYAFTDGGGDWTRSPRLYPRQVERICRTEGPVHSSGGPACQNPRSYTISNLIGGRDYDVAIRARNANGWGDWLSVGEFNLPNGFPPVLQSAAVNGATLTLTFDRSLDGDSRPSTSVFSVSVNGTSQTPTGIGISGSTVTLTLGTAVASGQTVTVSYTRPTQTPLQHNDAQGPSFSNFSVTNNTP
ncbi:MAG: hypothetical protein F4057_05890, partial [Acidobacteria bacterium]|nr:hypothetical protein [Acidobacteriota bacterium]